MSEKRRIDPLRMSLHGITLIEASAGTGKTYTLTTLYLRLLAEGFRTGQILVVTFTNAATAELRERIRSRIVDVLEAIEADDRRDPLVETVLETAGGNATGLLRRALSDFDDAAIFTIHGFCHRMLSDYAFESGIAVDRTLIKETFPLFRDIATDFWVNSLFNESPLVVQFITDHCGGPDGLMSLVNAVISKPDVRIVRPAGLDGAVDESGFRDAHREARRLWQRHESEIRVLFEEDIYNNKSFSIEKRQLVCDQISVYLSGEEPTRVFFDPLGTPISNKAQTGIPYLAEENLASLVRKKSTPPRHAFFDACNRLMKEAANLYPQMVRRLATFLFALIDYARTEVGRRKEDQGLLFFDDLLHMLDAAMQGERGDAMTAIIAGRYRAALIDEFQDTDQVQYRIFQRIFNRAGTPFILIGDPKQSIYRFRGADIFAYLDAVRDSGERRVELDINYRSAPGLIDALNALYEKSTAPFMFDDVPYVPVKAPPQAVDTLVRDGSPAPPLTVLTIGEMMNRDAIAETVADHIVDTLTGDLRIRDADSHTRRIIPSDITILVRDRGEAHRLRRSLNYRRIPLVMNSEQSVFESWEALELLRFLRGIASTGTMTARMVALCTSFIGLNGDDLRRLHEDDRQLETWFLRFRTWRTMWEQRGFSGMMNYLMSWQEDGEQSIMARLCSYDGGERRLTNIRHLIELIGEAEQRERLGMSGVIDWLERQRSSPGHEQESHELRLERDDDAVRIITIHKSKGLEFPIVFYPFIDNLFPKAGTVSNTSLVQYHDPGQKFAQVAELGLLASDEAREREAWEDFAETLRLQYVALTRARRACFITTTVPPGGKIPPLDMLIHHPLTSEKLDKAAIEQYCTDLDEAARIADLDDLVQRSGGAIGLTPLGTTPVPYRATTGHGPEELRCLTAKRSIHQLWQISSYSHLTSRRESLTLDEEEGRDLDANPADASTIGQAVSLDRQDAGAPSPLARERIILHDFERGPRAGRFLHRIFEDIDFTAKETDVRRRQLEKVLAMYRFESGQWLEPIDRALNDILNTPLDTSPQPLLLSHVPPKQRLNELEFMFPVAMHDTTDAEDRPKSLTVKRLGGLFKRHAGTAMMERYARDLEQLSFMPLRGFLKGFIDLVFTAGGRYYIVDYKSNHLGEYFDDYHPRHLEAAMIHHHYVLQYHLYTVALDRYLRFRVKDYDYETHMGGTRYLFIRGMAPRFGTQYGVFADRPPQALIGELSDMLGRSAASGRQS